MDNLFAFCKRWYYIEYQVNQKLISIPYGSYNKERIHSDEKSKTLFHTH